MDETITKERRRKQETFLAGAVFTFFLLLSCYKLTNASLWFDEAIEYWYSKVMFGPLPFSTTTDMYQRIVSTLQPPLYNFLLFFWLKISDTEWWFRFFGVFMGFLGMIALYRTVRRFGGSGYLAAGAVLSASCTFRLTYYWQEAAEYCLMLGALFWTVWFWMRVLEEPSGKNIVLFTLSACVPVYSQYGAAFPCAAMALGAWCALLLRGRRRALLCLSGAYLCALLFAALPLYVFFLRKQISLQHGGGGLEGISFSHGFLRDCLVNFHTVIRWNLFPDASGTLSRVFTALLLLGTAAVILWGRRPARAFALMNALSWLLYYFAVKAGIYADMSYGGFGNRYNLFFLPLWMVWIFLTAAECRRILSEEELLARYDVPRLFAGVLAACVLCFCVGNWSGRIRDNWTKEDIRGAVYAWYLSGAAGKDTLVYYAANAGFAYYARMNPGYTAQTEARTVYMPWYSDRSEAEYRAYLDEVYGPEWPEEVYVAASHIGDDLGNLIGAFRAAGYAREFLYERNDGYLARLTR